MRERFHLALDEARSAVNDDRMLIEKFIDRRIRRIEIQVCVCVCVCERERESQGCVLYWTAFSLTFGS